MFRDPLVAFTGDGPERGGRGVEDVHLVLLDHFPETVRVRIARHALEQDPGGPVAQRAIHDVRVAGDPADVGRAPEDLLRMIVEDKLVSYRRVE